MRKLILPGWLLLVLLCIIGAVVVAEYGFASIIEAWTKVSEGPCAFKSLVKDGQKIRLNVDCDGNEGRTESVQTIVDYLSNPGPLSCSLWASGKAVCRLEKK